MPSPDQIQTEVGWSRAAWTRLAESCALIGWFDGWHAAAAVLPPSTVRSLAVAHLFQNIAPTLDGAMMLADSIRAEDWQTVLAAETVHAKGLTARHVAGAQRARRDFPGMTPVDRVRAMQGWSKNLQLSIPPNAWSWWRVWLAEEHPAGVLRDRERDVWREPYAFLPDAALDTRTPEGRALGELIGEPVRRTPWTLDAQGHLDTAATVKAHGWGPLRRLALIPAPDAVEKHAHWVRECGTVQRDLFA